MSHYFSNRLRSLLGLLVLWPTLVLAQITGGGGTGSGGGGGGAPTNATYITQTPNGTLSAEQALSALATGLLKNTTATGVLSIAAAGTDYLTWASLPNPPAMTALGSSGAPFSNLSVSQAPTSIPGGALAPVSVNLTYTPSGDADTSQINAGSFIIGTTTSAHNLNPNGSLNGLYVQASWDGSGTLSNLVGVYSLPYLDGGGTVTNFASFWGFGAQTSATSSVTNSYGIYLDAPIDDSSGGSVANHFGMWQQDIGQNAAVVNPYYSWFDSRGVRRVKEDTTFDSVGQAIEALYNPQFTKYTPGAVDFERVVLGQWNGNVAEIGTQVGVGSSVLRGLRLIGASLNVVPAATFNSTVTAIDFIPTTTRAANLLYAGPATGSAAVPTWRSLVAADIPDVSTTYSLKLLQGTTASIGGGLLAAAGSCATGTATVTGAVVGKPVFFSTSDGSAANSLVSVYASVTATNTVTLQECALAAVTPAAKTWNVAVAP